MRHALAATVVLLLLAGPALAQDLVNDNGFDQPVALIGDTDQPNSNGAWEWLGAADWWLYGWPNGDTQGVKYYNGQYGPSKAPRDFTGQASNAWNPFPGGTPGLVKAHLTDSMVFVPAGVVGREAKASDPSDYFIRFYDWATQMHYVTSESVAAGTRLLVKLDYVSPSDDQRIELFGMLDNNLTRTPYFSWDTADDSPYTPSMPDGSVNLGDVVDPGPDIAMSWGGGAKWDGHTNSGQFFGEMILDPAADWTTAQQGFTVPTPDIARTGDAAKTSFDNIGLEFFAGGNLAEIRGIDNLHLYVLLGGDADESGTVDLADLAILATNWNTAEAMDWTTGDFTNDGAVDLADLAVLATNWNQTAEGFVGASSGMSFADAVAAVGLSVVPEPATLSLLGLGALGLLRRRR